MFEVGEVGGHSSSVDVDDGLKIAFECGALLLGRRLEPALGPHPAPPADEPVHERDVVHDSGVRRVGLQLRAGEHAPDLDGASQSAHAHPPTGIVLGEGRGDPLPLIRRVEPGERAVMLEGEQFVSHRTGDIARDVGEVVQRGDVETGGEQRGLVSLMRNLRRHVLKAGQRQLRIESLAVEEPVTDGEAERERGVTEMRRELVPFLEGQIVGDLQAERGDVGFRIDGFQIVHGLVGLRAGRPDMRGALSRSAWRATDAGAAVRSVPRSVCSRPRG